MVELRGQLQGGGLNTVAFTLPAGFRPSYRMDFPTVTNGVVGLISIATNGQVTLNTANNTAVTLNGITFQQGA